MPSLVVAVNEEPVTVHLKKGDDDLTRVATVLEAMGYAIDPAFPEVMVEGKSVSLSERVDYQKTYKFVTQPKSPELFSDPLEADLDYLTQPKSPELFSDPLEADLVLVPETPPHTEPPALEGPPTTSDLDSAHSPEANTATKAPPSTPAATKKAVAKNRERYFLCQVPGCGTKIRRPWNHISQGKLHGGLSKDDRRMYVELTYAVGQIWEDEKKEKGEEEEKSEDVVKAESTSVVSIGRQRFGETKTMPMFSLEIPILVEFRKYMGSHRGGEKKDSQQREIATDLSKFLHHCSSDVDLNNVVRMKAVNEYVDELEKRKIGPSGIVSKLNTLCYAQTFVIDRISDDPSEEELALITKANAAKIETQQMKRRLTKKKNALAARKNISKQLTPPAELTPPTELTRFLQSDETFDEVLKVADVDVKDVLVQRFLICFLAYTNFQRQGAVTSMTVGEVMAAEKSRDYVTVLVCELSTRRSSCVVMHIRVYQLLVRYVGAKAGADPVFTTSTGEKVTHIAAELEKLGEHFGKKFSLTPTPVCKQIDTAVCLTGTKADVKSKYLLMSAHQLKGNTDKCVDRSLQLKEMAVSAMDTKALALESTASSAPSVPEADNLLTVMKRKRALNDFPSLPQRKKRSRYSVCEEQLVREFFNIEERTTLARLSECAQFLRDKQGGGAGNMFVGRTPQQIQDKVKGLLRQKQK